MPRPVATWHQDPTFHEVPLSEVPHCGLHGRNRVDRSFWHSVIRYVELLPKGRALRVNFRGAMNTDKISALYKAARKLSIPVSATAKGRTIWVWRKR